MMKGTSIKMVSKNQYFPILSLRKAINSTKNMFSSKSQAIIELEKRNGYNDEQISKIVNGYKQNGVIEYLIDKLPTYFDMTNYVGLKTDW